MLTLLSIATALLGTIDLPTLRSKSPYSPPIQNSRSLPKSPDTPPSCSRSSAEESVSETRSHGPRPSLNTRSLHLRRLHHRRRQLVEVGSRHNCWHHRRRLRRPGVHPKHRAACEHEVRIQRLRRRLGFAHEHWLTGAGTRTPIGVRNKSDQARRVATRNPDSTDLI